MTKNFRLMIILLAFSFSLSSCFLSDLFEPLPTQSIYITVNNATKDSTCGVIKNPRTLKFSISNLSNDTIKTLEVLILKSTIPISYKMKSGDKIKIAFYEEFSKDPFISKTFKFAYYRNDPVRTITYCESSGIVLRDLGK